MLSSNLPRLTPKSLKIFMSPYFNELELSQIVFDYIGYPFISRWSVTNNDDYAVVLPLDADGTYDMIVEWGDGSSSSIQAYNQDKVRHVYAEAGVYVIHINGILNGFSFGYDEIKRSAHVACHQIIDIMQWGCIGLGMYTYIYIYIYTTNLHNILYTVLSITTETCLVLVYLKVLIYIY